MLTLSVETLVGVTGGVLLAGARDAMANDVSVDSRTAGFGCAFIAIAGENTDGHDHIPAALLAGARVLVVSRPPEQLSGVLESARDAGAAVVHVADGVAALSALAAYHRSRLRAQVIGITGSTGKTTTKDFLTAILAPSLRVVANEGNRNNEIGLPLTVLKASSSTEVLVVEMGMRGLGQIAALARIAAPDMGLLTNVGTSHIELLGSQDAVAVAKGELVRAIPEGGAVLLNGDDAYSDALALEAVAPVSLYGLSARCDVRAEDIVLDSGSCATFTLVTPSGKARVSLPLPGRHNVYNALAAAAAASRFVPIAEIGPRLASAEVTGMRMQTFVSATGVTVVNDAYNANPASMRAAVETLCAMRAEGSHIAVLGDMAELGSLSELAHFQIGELVAHAGVDVLVTVGRRAGRIADGARAAGMDPGVVTSVGSAEEACEILGGRVTAGDIVLVKASRVMGLERVVEGIVNAGAC